ncbi:MAG: hypothetical protein E5V86_29420, partial [Mesorhizobium sp.]
DQDLFHVHAFLCMDGHVAGQPAKRKRKKPIVVSEGPMIQPISPLVGEMPGRAEGGAKERDLSA